MILAVGLSWLLILGAFNATHSTKEARISLLIVAATINVAAFVSAVRHVDVCHRTYESDPEPEASYSRFENICLYAVGASLCLLASAFVVAALRTGYLGISAIAVVPFLTVFGLRPLLHKRGLERYRRFGKEVTTESSGIWAAALGLFAMMWSFIILTLTSSFSSTWAYVFLFLTSCTSFGIMGLIGRKSR